eukprot:RCo005721
MGFGLVRAVEFLGTRLILPTPNSGLKGHPQQLQLPLLVQPLHLLRVHQADKEGAAGAVPEALLEVHPKHPLRGKGVHQLLPDVLVAAHADLRAGLPRAQDHPLRLCRVDRLGFLLGAEGQAYLHKTAKLDRLRGRGEHLLGQTRDQRRDVTVQPQRRGHARVEQPDVHPCDLQDSAGGVFGARGVCGEAEAEGAILALGDPRDGLTGGLLDLLREPLPAVELHLRGVAPLRDGDRLPENRQSALADHRHGLLGGSKQPPGDPGLVEGHLEQVGQGLLQRLRQQLLLCRRREHHVEEDFALLGRGFRSGICGILFALPLLALLHSF